MRFILTAAVLFAAAMVALWLSACGSNAEQAGSPSRLDALRERRVEVLEAAYAKLDAETGWASPTDCDGLLWASLAKAAGLPVNLAVAEYAGGELHRRPTPCYPDESGSEISNDMLLGYLWASAADTGALERLASYGEAHNWVMGEGDPARTVMRPNLQGLLGRLLFKQGVTKSYRLLPPVYPEVQSDYERHLQALGISLFGKLDGKITDQMLERLRGISQVEPENALYHSVLDRYTGEETGLDLLLGPQVVPTYVRGENPGALADIEWLFAAGLWL